MGTTTTRELMLDMVRGNAHSLEPKYKAGFADWLDANWGIWLRFCEEAGRIRRRGRDHYSARTIVEYIRHETALSEAADDFKINNNWAPSMARLYMDTNAGASEFFETREPA